MKKLIFLLAAIAITAGAYAQIDSTGKKMSPPDFNNTNDGMTEIRDMNNNPIQNVQNNPVNNSHPDGVMMQNGKMMMLKNGQTTVLDNEMTMSNGTKINSDGTYIKKDGTKMMMKEGQHVDMSGNMVPVLTKDKNVYIVTDSTKQK